MSSVPVRVLKPVAPAPVAPVPVALGWSPRAKGAVFHGTPFSPRAAALGQTEQAWFARAKAAVVKFDDLERRARTIASPPAREAILSRFVGRPGNRESGQYRRNSVAYNVGQAESFTPVNYLIFKEDRVRNRVEKLEEINQDFEAELVEAEKVYGVLAAPVTVERIVEVPAPMTENSTAPLLLGGALLVGLLLFALVG